MSNRRRPTNPNAASYPLRVNAAPSPTSGCSRRRRKAIERRHRVEDSEFWREGRIPASAVEVSICCCGATAFSRNPDEHLDDFAEQHAYCGEVSA